MLLFIALLAFFNAQVYAQPSIQVPMVMQPALACPTGVPCEGMVLRGEPAPDPSRSTVIRYFTNTVQEVLTETETTVTATVKMSRTSPGAICVTFIPNPPKPLPPITYYVNTTTTSYSFTTTTKTSTSTITATVQAPASCYKEVGRAKQPALPSQPAQLCPSKNTKVTAASSDTSSKK